MKMKGLIEGRRAREYAKYVDCSEKSEVYDNFILKNIKLNRKIKVCDFCCGPGNVINLLKDKVGEIVGVDASKEMVKICRERFGKNRKIKLKLSPVTKTDLPSSYFDYVIIRMGLHHVKEKEKVMGEIFRILKPRGRIIVIDKCCLNKLYYYLREIYKLIFKLRPSLFEHFIISWEETEKLFFQKFKIVKKEFLPLRKFKTNQNYMFVLEKK